GGRERDRRLAEAGTIPSTQTASSLSRLALPKRRRIASATVDEPRFGDTSLPQHPQPTEVASRFRLLQPDRSRHEQFYATGAASRITPTVVHPVTSRFPHPGYDGAARGPQSEPAWKPQPRERLTRGGGGAAAPPPSRSSPTSTKHGPRPGPCGARASVPPQEN